MEKLEHEISSMGDQINEIMNNSHQSFPLEEVVSKKNSQKAGNLLNPEKHIFTGDTSSDTHKNNHMDVNSPSFMSNTDIDKTQQSSPPSKAKSLTENI